MGNLILSRSPKKTKPFYVEKLGIHLYTAEELSYFIYNNLMLIDENFIDDKLCDFIEEAGYPQLTVKLKKWRDDSTVWELMLVILQDIHYYNSKELETFRDEAIRIAKEGYEGIYKEKADYLSEIGRLYEAIKMYDTLLSSRDIDNNKIKAEIYESKGVALARLFAFEEAKNAFLQGYELSPDERFLEKIYMTHLLDGSVNYPEELVKTALSKEYEPTLKKWNDKYSETEKQIMSEEPLAFIADLKERDTRKKKEGFLKLITDWKSEYKRNQN